MPALTTPGPGTGPPTTVAVAAINTYLQKGDSASPEVWTTYAEVKSIEGPGMSVNVVDTTNHSNTDSWRRKIPTLLDMGDLSFEINFIPTDATHNYATGMLGDFATRKLLHLRLKFPDNSVDSSKTTHGFYGYITKFSMSEPVDNVITAKIMVTPTGPPTFSA